MSKDKHASFDLKAVIRGCAVSTTDGRVVSDVQTMYDIDGMYIICKVDGYPMAFDSGGTERRDIDDGWWGPLVQFANSLGECHEQRHAYR